MHLRITSQNLKHGGLQTPDGAPDDGRRWIETVAVLTGEAPDIVCLQEIHGWRSHNHQQLFRAEKALGMRVAGWLPGARSISGTLLMYRHRPGMLELVQWEDKDGPEVYHGMGVAVFDVAGIPLTVASVHFDPTSARIAETEAARITARIQRYGAHGVFAGDVNHHPAQAPGDGDPVPPPERVTPLNRAGRWRQDDHGGLVPDRTVATYLTRAGMTDAARHLAARTEDPSLLQPTGQGGIRVDQAWCTPSVVPALTAYRRIGHGASDHAAISIDVDTDRIDGGQDAGSNRSQASAAP